LSFSIADFLFFLSLFCYQSFGASFFCKTLPRISLLLSFIMVAFLVVFFVPSISSGTDAVLGQRHVALFSFSDSGNFFIQSWVSEDGGSAALDAIFLLLAFTNIVLNFFICAGWILFKSKFVVARDFYQKW
jgi:hypothetical protein